MRVSSPSLPRHNSSTNLPDELPAELLCAPLVWVRQGGLVPPLQPLYYGPYAVLPRGPCSFTIRVGSRDEVVAVSCLKACTAANATPGSLRRRGRPPGLRPGVLAATKGVSFSDPLVSSPSSPPALPRDGPGTVFLPGEEILHAWDQRRLHGLHRRGTHLVKGHRPRGWTSDLYSSQPWPELWGALLRAGYTPGDHLTSWVNSTTCCTVPVYKLLFIRQ